MTPVTVGSTAAEQSELATLLDEVRDFSGGLLASAGTCPPFGTTITGEGKPGLVVYQPSPGMTGAQFIDRLAGMLRKQARDERLRAASVAYAVSAEAEGQRIEAVVVSVQHRTGNPLEVILPFDRRGAAVEFGEPVVRPGEMRFF